jgi:undecaprenyl-diphosphatase
LKILFIIVLIFFSVAAAEIVENMIFPEVTYKTAEFFPAWINEWDKEVFKLLNIEYSQPALDSLFIVLTRLGSTEVWIVVAVGLWFFGKRREAMLLVIGLAISSLITIPLKLFIPRPRPFHLMSEARMLTPEGGHSFPSGHSKNVFLAATVLRNKNTALSIFLYALAFTIAYSRIYVGVHWATDVAAGSLIGLAVGQLVLNMQGKLEEIFLPLIRVSKRSLKDALGLKKQQKGER